jgi:ryanodine receptor 2
MTRNNLVVDIYFSSLHCSYCSQFFLYFLNFRGLETLQVNRRASVFFLSVNLGEMVMCLEDLINYFAQPGEEMGN